jgi:hypothetical protein
MTAAVCIRCGLVKRHPAARCPRCAFTPTTTNDLAKSWILSTRYRVPGRPGWSRRALEGIGKRIEAGEPFPFDDRGVAEVEELQRLAEQTPVSRFSFEVLKFLALPILVIFVAIIMLRGC